MRFDIGEGLDFAEAVAFALGGWRLEPPRSMYDNMCARVMIGRSGNLGLGAVVGCDAFKDFGVRLRVGDGRLEIAALMPRPLPDGWRFSLDPGEKWPRITMSWDIAREQGVGPLRVAREITRRLLPAYERLWDSYLKQLEAHVDFEARSRRLVGELATILDADWTGSGRHHYLLEDGAYSGDVTVNGDAVTFNVRVESRERALAVARALKGVTK